MNWLNYGTPIQSHTKKIQFIFSILLLKMLQGIPMCMYIRVCTDLCVCASVFSKHKPQAADGPPTAFQETNKVKPFCNNKTATALLTTLTSALTIIYNQQQGNCCAPSRSHGHGSKLYTLVISIFLLPLTRVNTFKCQFHLRMSLMKEKIY